MSLSCPAIAMAISLRPVKRMSAALRPEEEEGEREGREDDQ